MEDQPDQYQVYARPSMNLPRQIATGIFKPRDGYTFAGSMPTGEWVVLMYRKTEQVQALQETIAHQSQQISDLKENTNG